METIGEVLRAAREARKIPVAQVVRDTRISEKYVVAMEADEFSHIPAPTYAKGFIKIYATYLGLDPQPLIEQFLREHVVVSKQLFSIEGDRLATDIVSRNWKLAAAGAAAIGILAALVLMIMSLTRSCAGPQVMVEESASEELEMLPLPPLLSSPVPLQAETENNGKESVGKGLATLTARAGRDDVWMKVYADGVLLFEDIIQRGDEQSWTSQGAFHLRVGRPDAITLLLNGVPLKGWGDTAVRNVRIDGEGNVSYYKGKMQE